MSKTNNISKTRMLTEAAIMLALGTVLSLIKILELWPKISKVLIARESIKISEHCISLNVTRVTNIEMSRISVHALYL